MIVIFILFMTCKKEHETESSRTVEWNRERNKLKRPYATASELMTLIALREPGILTRGVHVIVRCIARL